MSQSYNAATPDHFVSISKTCQELHISRATRWRMARDGKLPIPIKIGSKVGYSRKSLDRWKAEQGFVVEGV